MAGFVNVRLEEEKPIFNKQRIDFTPPEKINHLAVCNNQLCMSLGKDTILRHINVVLRSPLLSLIGCCVAQTNACMVCLIYRIDLAKPDQPNQIELGRRDDSKVHKLFLDPTGEKIGFVYFTSLKLRHIDRNVNISLVRLTVAKSQLNGNNLFSYFEFPYAQF